LQELGSGLGMAKKEREREKWFGARRKTETGWFKLTA
jgi:hypothetical protein